MKRYWYQKKSLKALLGMLGLMVAAAGSGLSDEIYLESVVTPARRAVAQEKLPLNTSVVTKQQIRKKNALTLDQALEGTLGVTSVERSGTLGQFSPVTLRGFRPKHTLLMVDGVRIVDGGGEANMPNFPLDNIERVEVLRGPGSALYGANAMAGAYNLITKEPEDGPATTDITASFGSFKTQKYGVEFGAKPGRLGAYVTGSKMKSEGFRNNSGYDADYYSGKFNYDATARDRITLSGQFFKSSVGTPGPSLVQPIEFNNDRELIAATTSTHQEDTRTLGAAGYRRVLGEATTVQVRVFGTHLSRLYDSPDASFGAIKSEGMSNTVGGEVQVDHPIHESVVLTEGGEFRRDGYKNTDLLLGKTVPDVTRDVTAGFVQALGTFGNLSVLPGVRVERDQAFGTETMPRLGAAYRLTEQVRVTGNVGRSFRAPSFIDLFWPGFGNPALAPERAWTHEVGAEAKPVEPVIARVTAFRTDMENKIAVAFDASTKKFFAQNLSTTVSQGVEAEVSHRIVGGLTHAVYYTFMETAGADAKGNPLGSLAYVPTHSGGYRLGYEAGFGFSARLDGRLVGERYNGDKRLDKDNAELLAGYGVWNLRLAQKILDLEIFAQADNVFDQRYIASSYFAGDPLRQTYPLPGRTFVGGLRMRFWG